MPSGQGLSRVFTIESKPYSPVELIGMQRQYLKTRQVAQILGVSLNTVYRWLKQEKISEPLRDADNNYRLWTAENVERIRQELRAGRS